MKKLFLSLAAVFGVIVLFGACSSARGLQGFDVENSFKVHGSYDDVWDGVIGYISSCNYKVTSIEKESGIISIGACRFKACVQGYGVRGMDYYYIIEDCGKYRGESLYVTSNWNIRVKKVSDYVQIISINLSDNSRVVIDNSEKRKKKDEVITGLDNQSTGIFERKVLRSILDELRKGGVSFGSNGVRHNNRG